MRFLVYILLVVVIPLLVNFIADIAEINFTLNQLLILSCICIVAVALFDFVEKKRSHELADHQPEETSKDHKLDHSNMMRGWADCPTDDKLFGRKPEIKTLKKLLKRHCSLVIVSGEPGVGKTALVAFVTRKMAARYKAVLWHSFLYPRPIKQSLRQWLEDFGSSPDGDWQELIDRLALHLTQIPALVILDNYETAVFNNRSSDDVKRVKEFVKRMAATIRNGSVVLTSSHELPTASAEFQQVTIERVQLRGLDGRSIRSLARSIHGLKIDAWIAEAIATKTSGNPQVARLIFDLVKTTGRNINEAIEEILVDVRGSLEPLLDRHLLGLNKKQLHMLFIIALWRRPVTEAEVQEWFPRATITLIDATETRSVFRYLRTTSFFRKVEGDRVSLTARILEVLTSRIITRIVEHVLENRNYEFLDEIALNHALWPEDLRQGIRDKVFLPAANWLIQAVGDPDEGQQIIKNSLERGTTESVFNAANHIELLRACGDPQMLLRLRGRSLRGTDFQSALLAGSDLRGCDLRDVRFSDANGPIYTVGASESEKDLIAVGLASGSVEIRKLPQCELIAQCHDGHTQPVRWVFLNSEYCTVISAGEDGRVCKWNYQTNTTYQLYSHESWVWDGDVRNGLLVTAASDCKAVVYDLSEGSIVLELKCPSERIWCVSWDGDELMIGGESGNLWRSVGLLNAISIDNQSDIVEWETLHKFGCPIKAFALNGELVATGLADGFIHVINKSKVKKLHSIKTHNGTIRTITWLNSGEIVSSGDDGLVRITDGFGSELISKTMLYVGSRVWRLAAVPERSSSAFVSVGDDRVVRFWDPQIADVPIGSQSGYGQGVRSIDVLNNQILVSADDDLLRILDRTNTMSKEAIVLKRHSRIRAAKFLNADRLAVAFDSGELAFVNLAQPQQSESFVKFFEGHTGAIEYLGISQDRKRLVSCGEDRIARVWDDQGNVLQVLSSFHQNRVWAAEFLGDRNIVVTAGGEFALAWWNIDREEPIATGSGHTNLILTLCTLPNDLVVSGGSDGTLRFWSLGREEFSIPLPVTVRGLCYVSDMDAVVAVGRAERSSRDGWVIALLDLETRTISEIPLGKMGGGTARTVNLLTPRTVVVGGDGPKLLAVELGSRRIRKLETVSGPYEKISISESSKGLTNRLRLSLEMLGATFEESQEV